MTEPLNLPDEPTLADLAKGLKQTHGCLDDLRNDLAPGIAFLANTRKVTNRVWKFGVWIGPVIIAAIIGAYANLVVAQNATNANTQQAAQAAKASLIVTAHTHATVSHALGLP